ncbi:MAG: lipoyl synthase [Gammaproteobacteria bacterium]
MNEFKTIPIVVAGQKYTNGHGTSAIRRGIKSNSFNQHPSSRKPSWLRVRLPSGGRYESIKERIHELGLSTVCEESLCPNIGECWGRGTATLMLMGAVCTRACRFCAVDTGNPRGWLDPNEPDKVARMVEHMALQYVVLTSVDRDDLRDGGASHYAASIRAVKARNPGILVEALTPDFAGDLQAVDTVIDSGVDVYAQNLETVNRLTSAVRDPRASYRQTLDILAHAKAHAPTVITKSSLMLGLGETQLEVEQTFDDLKRARADVVTLGQYLRPTLNHLPVDRYLSPDDFSLYRESALTRGFLEVVAGPFVRSSYRAEQVFAGKELPARDTPG